MKAQTILRNGSLFVSEQEISCLLTLLNHFRKTWRSFSFGALSSLSPVGLLSASLKGCLAQKHLRGLFSSQQLKAHSYFKHCPDFSFPIRKPFRKVYKSVLLRHWVSVWLMHAISNLSFHVTECHQCHSVNTTFNNSNIVNKIYCPQCSLWEK